MNNSLPSIAEYLAERAGRQNDFPFRKQMEDAAVNWRATLVTNSLAKNPAQKSFYMQSILMPLAKVSKQDNEDADGCDTCVDTEDITNFCEELKDCGCEDVFRTKDKVPDTLRISLNPFDYVGSPGGAKAFGWTTFGSEVFKASNPIVGKLPRYTLLNDYIYIFREKNLLDLRIEGVFADPRDLYGLKCANQTEPCYTKTSDFPVDGRMKQQIIQYVLSVDLHIPSNKEEIEVKADKDV